MVSPARAGIPTSRKIALTLVMTLLIAALGAAYQYYYLEERAEYSQAISAYYLKERGERPDPVRLKHLVTLALDRFGPTEFLRNEEDYHRLLREGLS